MPSQDWENKDHYKYTEELTSAGWAWEFIRRSKRYRNAYIEGKIDPIMNWNLKKFYPPDEQFHSGVEFQYVNRHPLFFGLTGGTWDFLGAEQLAKFPEILSIEKLADNIKIYSDTILVAFDTSLPLSNQLKKAEDLLARYQAGRPFVSHDETKIRKEYQHYLRVLDAILAKTPLSQAEVMEKIHPEKTWPTNSADPNDKKKKDVGWKDATSQQKASYGHDAFEKAQSMAHEGYQKILKRLSLGI